MEKRSWDYYLQSLAPKKNDGIVLIQDSVIAKTAEWSIEGKFKQEEIQELRKIAKIKAAENMDPEEYIHRNYVYMAGQDNVRIPFEYLKKVLECDYANVTNQITMFD